MCLHVFYSFSDMIAVVVVYWLIWEFFIILKPSPLLNMWPANIFLTICSCVLIHFKESLCCKMFNYGKVRLSIFPSKDCAFGVKPKTSVLVPEAFLFFFPQSFIVLHFTFKSAIYFELVFTFGHPIAPTQLVGKIHKLNSIPLNCFGVSVKNQLG